MLTPTIIAQVLWTSLATSSYYVLFSLAFSLVLKINGAFNFAQAAMMTGAFYAAYTLVGIAHLPGWVGFGGAILASVVLALLTELLGFRLLRRRRAEQLFVFIFTLIVSEFVAFVAMLIFGSFPTTIFSSLVWPVTLVGPVAVSGWDIPALLSTAAAVACVFLLLRFTKIGQAMTAVSDNAELAELYGIKQGAHFPRRDGRRRAAGRPRHVSLRHAGPGAAQHLDRPDDLRHCRNDHGRHRQSRGHRRHRLSCSDSSRTAAFSSCPPSGRAFCSTRFSSRPSYSCPTVSVCRSGGECRVASPPIPSLCSRSRRPERWIISTRS